ncbi:hypothetical protein [Candidatus Neptunochlamydia vexilliferae]|uniref:Lipoprotein n=1 Tax=Candidatus Neptunichlamydia vexilliferae TaxID=1651774 RepID=A0ABS0AZG3_9BACT|nr:hypothetical protein [Candidatus Neptunochlamydia vexilliferae]MBF5059528.1 hypothetical protein [Candidatus Neptunochlamydia vexilliferae]
MKYLALALLLLLTSCCRDGWKHTAIKSGSPDYDISKLTHPASDPANGIELELTRYGKEIHGYIHVKTFELPSHEDEHATTLTITTPQKPILIQGLGVYQSQRSRFSPIEADPYPRDKGDAEGGEAGDAGAGKNQILSQNGFTKTFVIPLLEGGQRARLTDTCLSYLIQVLEMYDTATLTSGHFSETISGANFQRHHDALMRCPSALRPQNLITFEIL